MKRSTIESQIKWAKALVAKVNFKLPFFSEWTLDDWKLNKDKLETIRQTLLGWDVTDFGSDDFDKIGAVLFTIRNGVYGKQGIGSPYAEKLILMHESQVLPLHFHYKKTEDIINRGCGMLDIQVFNALENGEIDKQNDVTVYTDGFKNTVKAGTIFRIQPGCSMTITPYLYHLFVAEKGFGDLVVGEVSAINDDTTDNRFAVASKRYIKVDEDVPITVPLLNEYEKLIFAN